jgi:hypothetical protein
VLLILGLFVLLVSARPPQTRDCSEDELRLHLEEVYQVHFFLNIKATVL